MTAARCSWAGKGGSRAWGARWDRWDRRGKVGQEGQRMLALGIGGAGGQGKQDMAVVWAGVGGCVCEGVQGGWTNTIAPQKLHSYVLNWPHIS